MFRPEHDTHRLQQTPWGHMTGSLSSRLIVGGAVLFVIPEPATSLVGMVLMLAGIASWATDRRVGDGPTP